MSVVVGIDPDKHGAIASREGAGTPILWDIPRRASGDVDWLDVLTLLKNLMASHVFCERPEHMPSLGHKRTAAAFGFAEGLKAVCECQGLSLSFAVSREWQAAMLPYSAKAPRQPRLSGAPIRPSYENDAEFESASLAWNEARKAIAREKNEQRKRNKLAAIRAAEGLFPMVKIENDGQAEALLIMEYGRRMLNGNAGG